MIKDLSCLENLIGIKTECDNIPSTSGYFIHNIEGVSLNFGDKISDPEYISGFNFLKTQRTFAANLVYDELGKSMVNWLRPQTVLESAAYCQYTSGVFNGPGASTKGILIKYNTNYLNTRRRSRYSAIVIPSVQIYSNTDTTINLKIKDGTLPEVEYDAIQLSAGQITNVVLNYVATFESVYIYFDQTAIVTGTTDCSSGCYSCGTSGKKPYSQFLTVTGYDGSSETANQLNGIIPTVNVECNIGKVICAHSSNFGLAMLYKMGFVLYNQLAYTKRLNRYTIYTKQGDAIDRAQYFDHLYLQQMDTTTKSMFNQLKKVKDECLQCNTTQYGFIHG